MGIHPTAIIHPDAQLAPDVEIGPYVCIQGPAFIGPGCKIQAHAILTGSVQIGENNQIGYGAVIGADPQSLSFRPEIQSTVRIGNGNIIREYCTIHRSMMEQGATLVGDGNFLMAGAHLGHDVRLGNRVIVANNTLLGGHVEVGDRAFLGGGAVFHQFVQIGELAIIQGNSAFSKNIPPYLIGAEHNSIFGINVVGIRRAGFDSAQRREIKEAFNLLYRSGFNTAQALEHAKSRPWSELGRRFFDFVSTASKRGICDLHHSHARTMPV